jgi:eukaryotic-like serine/threonine-protein kinase
MFSPGDVVGPYTLVRNLGEGHFGVVWLAEHGNRPSHREVALKALKHSDSNLILQEVFNWAKADGHPNVLTILEAGVYPTRHGDLPVIVSNYLPEGSLRGWMNRNQPLSLESTVELSCGILDGLEHLHRRRIVHRDLKPENVLMYQGSPLLTDFGIARFQLSDTDVQTNVIAGTVPYMAPESFHGIRSPQVDVWAAAVMCYEMLAGRRPFPPDPYAVSTAALPPLPNFVPRELRKVLEFALRKDPAIRCYKAAAELRFALLKTASTMQTQIRLGAEKVDSIAGAGAPGEAQTLPLTTRMPQPETPVPSSQKVLKFEGESLEAEEGTLINQSGQARGKTGDARTDINYKRAKFGTLKIVNNEEK